MTEVREQTASETPTPLFIIAEAGVNHNGDVGIAEAMIDVAAEAGADAVKFQTFRAASLTTDGARLAAYQQRQTVGYVSQAELLQALELDLEAHHALKRRCDERGVEFMSTGFDIASLMLLTREIGLRRLKIPSGEAVNALLLRAAMLEARDAELPIILSTGMCELDEVLEALSVLAWTLREGERPPSSRAELSELRDAPDWTAPLQGRVSILHCVTDYPARAAATNLRAMETMRLATGLDVGLSDHSEGWHVALAAVGAGARLIEKHFTLSQRLPGPDHAASLEPDALARMIRELREVDTARGDGEKAPQPEEFANRDVVRGGLVAAVAIAEGDRFTLDNMVAKRPRSGIAPFDVWDLLSGPPADRAYAPNESIEPSND